MKINRIRIGLVSTYPPVLCGIAMYSWYLIQELKKKKVEIILYPIEKKEMDYSERVGFRIKKDVKESYVKAGEKLNKEDLDIILLQHQFLLFGKNGRYTKLFLQKLKVPILAVIHTVPQNPSFHERVALTALSNVSLSVVMIKEAKKILVENYGFSDNAVEIISHPCPNLIQVPAREARRYLHIPQDAFVIFTFGLLRKEKGIEDALAAFSYLKNENVLYIIAGIIHPEHYERNGEKYSRMLKGKIREYGIEHRVRWINRYLNEKELSLYLSAVDVCLTPYRSLHQVSSGTISYALGMGKVVISTPFPFAEEMLKGGRGIIVKPYSPLDIASKIKDLIYNKNLREYIAKKVRGYTDKIKWEKAGERFYELIKKSLNARYSHSYSL